MEKDLLTKYLVEARNILKSPLLSVPEQLLPTEDQIRRPSDADSQDSSDSFEEDIFARIDFVKAEQVQALKDLKVVIRPGEFRQNLIEYLLEKYEHGIVEDCCNSPEVALRQLGLWADRKKTSLSQIVNFYDSVQLLWRLSTLVHQSMLSLHTESDFKRSEQMLSFVCKEQQEIFNPAVRLFPMNFAPKQESTFELADQEVIQMHFKEEIEGLLRYIEDTQFKLDEINASDYIKSSGKAPIGRPDVQEINMASLEDLRALRESLAFLKSQVVQFNHLCDEGGFKDELARIPSQETPAGQNLRGQLGE